MGIVFDVWYIVYRNSTELGSKIFDYENERESKCEL